MLFIFTILLLFCVFWCSNVQVQCTTYCSTASTYSTYHKKGRFINGSYKTHFLLCTILILLYCIFFSLFPFLPPLPRLTVSAIHIGGPLASDSLWPLLQGYHGLGRVGCRIWAIFGLQAGSPLGLAGYLNPYP